MTDAELIEKVRSVGPQCKDPNSDISYSLISILEAEEIINMVREHDTYHERYKDVYSEAFELGKKMQVGIERAKVKAECIEAIRKMHDECGGLSLHYALKALEDV